eukprot:1185030-Prorocentrum_minimum.AAC.3
MVLLGTVPYVQYVLFSRAVRAELENKVERLEREHVHDSRRMRQMEEASMKVTCELVKFLNPTVHKSPKILLQTLWRDIPPAGITKKSHSWKAKPTFDGIVQAQGRLKLAERSASEQETRYSVGHSAQSTIQPFVTGLTTVSVSNQSSRVSNETHCLYHCQALEKLMQSLQLKFDGCIADRSEYPYVSVCRHFRSRPSRAHLRSLQAVCVASFLFTTT